MRRRALALCAVVLLASCGERPFPYAGASGPASPPRSPVTFTIAVPAPGPASRSRALAYAAPATRSVAIAIDPGPDQQTATQNLGVGSPGCTSPSLVAPAVCSVVFSVAPGDHVFRFAAYDGALDRLGKPQGALLARNGAIPFAVGQAATVNVALRGAPASIAVLPGARQDVQGTQQAGFDVYGVFKADGKTPFDRTFTAVARDAGGSYLLGADAPAVALTSSDPNTFSSGAASESDPNTFKLTAAGYNATRLELAATAGPLTVRVPLRIVARNAPRIYVMDHLTRNVGKVWVFDDEGNQIAVGGAFAGLDGGLGIGYDKRLKRLYVTNEYASEIAAYDLEGNAIAMPGAFPNLYFPLGLYVDNARGRIYAGNFNGGIDNQGDGAAGTGPCAVPRAARCGVTVYDDAGKQLSVAGAWREQEGVVPYLPYGVLADANGARIYVSDAGYNRAEAYDARGHALFSWPSGAGAHGLAQDAATKDLYVADDAACVSRFDRQGLQQTLAAGNCTNRDSTVPDADAFQNVRGPIAVRQNPANGWLYVANYANNSVTAYDRDGTQIALRGKNLNSGPFGFNGTSGVVNGPIGIEIVP